MPSLDDALFDLSLRPQGRSKSAELRDLAGALSRAQQEPVTFEDLYAVKTAGEAPEAPSGDDALPGAPLRKLAHAVRVAEHTLETERLEKVATLRRAVRGLTLLNERVSK